MGSNIKLDDVLASNFGEASSTIRATFKKTVLLRQYETEVIELESTVTFDKPLSSAERFLLSAILKTQLEYTAYCDMVYKGLVTQTEFENRRKVLEDSMNAIKEKAESVLGRSLDEYFKTTV